ncbi:MAG: O-antigen ligase family protein [Rhodanobacter sp.]
MQASLKPWSAYGLSILLALIPLSLSIDQRIKVLPVALPFIAGLWFVATNAQTQRSYRYAWTVVAAALLVIGFIALNVLIHQLGWRPLDRAAHVLLYLLIGAAFTQALRLSVLWGGLSLSAIALGSVCLVQRYGQGIERAYGLSGGPASSIEFATLLLGLALVALARLLDKRTGNAERVLHITAMAFGMYGALLTQSRGPLLAFAPAFVLLVLLHVRRSGRWRVGLLFVVGACLGAALAMSTMRDEITERFAAIAPEVTTFDEHHAARGAVGERLEMWVTAARAVAEHPLVGIGIGEFNHYVDGEIAAGRSNRAIGRYNQPHNEYIEAAATGGIPGLLVLLATFLVPLGYFARHVRDLDEAVLMPARAGLAVVILYMLCALTDSVFYRVTPQSFYFFVVLGMALLIARLRSTPDAGN